MSFILDALKKSEIERQRQTTPGLIESGIVSRRPRVAVWAIALGALLGINLLVLLFVLTRSGTSAAPAPVAVRPPVAASSAAPTSIVFSMQFNYLANALPARPTGSQAPLFTGAIAGYAGLYQINFVVPALPAGTPACAVKKSTSSAVRVVAPR